MAIKVNCFRDSAVSILTETTKDERFTRRLKTMYETTKDMTGEDDNGGRYDGEDNRGR